MKNGQQKEVDRKAMSALNEYKNANIDLKRNLEEEKLTVTATLR